MHRRLLLALAAVPLPARAAEAPPEVQDPWARATAGRAPNGAAYLTIVNPGTEPNRLVAAASPVARRVELHTHLTEGGVMRMRAVDAIEVAPGDPAVLRPGGLHIMLLGLEAPLQEGTTFPLTLRFAQAGEVTVAVRVLGVGAMGPPHRH